MTSEDENLIIKKFSTNIRFDKKMVNNGGKGFLLTAKFHNSANNAVILAPQKGNPEGKSAVHPEVKVAKNQ